MKFWVEPSATLGPLLVLGLILVHSHVIVKNLVSVYLLVSVDVVNLLNEDVWFVVVVGSFGNGHWLTTRI